MRDDNFAGMLAEGGEKEKLADYGKQGFIAEPKLDGIRFILSIDGERVSLVSRGSIDDSPRYPFLDPGPWSKELRGTVLDGEMVVLKSEESPLWEAALNGIQSINGSDVAKARRRCSERHVFFVVFDILKYAGVSMTKHEWNIRRQMLEQNIFEPDSKILAPEVVLIEPVSREPEKLWNQIVPPAEGIMLKHKDSPYESKRSKNWLKVKDTEESSGVIVGWKPGIGKFTNMVGSIFVEGVESGKKFKGRIAAFTDEERAALTDRDGTLRKEWLGRKVRVKYFMGGVFSLRHCQLVRFEED